MPSPVNQIARTFRWPIPKTDEVRVRQNDEYHLIEALTGRPYSISLKEDFYVFTVVDTGTQRRLPLDEA